MSTGSIGDRIKLIRNENKLTQIDFAKSLDISQGTLSEIESGKARPSFEALLHIAEKYTANLNWLVLDRQDELQYGLQRDELELMENYRNLQDIAKEEVRDYVKMKLIRYHKR